MLPIGSLTLFAVLFVVPMASSSPDPLTVLVNYGGLVGAFVLVIIGRLHTTGEVTILKEQIALLNEQAKAKDSILAAFTQSFTNRAIPMIQQVGDVLGAIPEQESALTTLLRESLAHTAELTATLKERDRGE